MSLMLLGYIVDFDKIYEYQRQFRYQNPTQAQQVWLQNAIIANVDKQFASLKKLFIENSKCEKCRASPMVAGSVHQNFTNANIQAIWDELVDAVDGKSNVLLFSDMRTWVILANANCCFLLEMKRNPLHIVNDHMLFIKKKFEQVEAAYRRDNVAAAGLC